MLKLRCGTLKHERTWDNKYMAWIVELPGAIARGNTLQECFQKLASIVSDKRDSRRLKRYVA